MTKITDPKPYLLLAYSVRATVNHWFQEDKELRDARAGLPLAERNTNKEREEDEKINLHRARHIQMIMEEHVAPDTAARDALKKLWDAVEDLGKSNPGFLGKLVLQDYAGYNEAMIAAHEAMIAARNALK